jgi:hypothetical protein
MEIDLIADLHIVAHGHSPAGVVHDRQHYLVALDAASLSAMTQGAPASTPDPEATPPSI